MVDYHSHVLPAMDDGAKDVPTALAMLEQAGQQGVDRVVATPHFYHGEDTATRFLARRKRCYEQLLSALTAEHPQVLLGAEVLVWEGMSKEDMHPFCIEGTDLLLVEFPFSTMPHWLIEELENIILVQDITVVLAHLERYRPWYTKQDVAMLLDLPDVVVQLDCDSLTGKWQLYRIAKWLSAPDRLVLGTDMHNADARAPQMEKAMRVLSRSRVGRRWLSDMEDFI